MCFLDLVNYRQNANPHLLRSHSKEEKKEGKQKCELAPVKNLAIVRDEAREFHASKLDNKEKRGLVFEQKNYKLVTNLLRKALFKKSLIQTVWEN